MKKRVFAFAMILCLLAACAGCAGKKVKKEDTKQLSNEFMTITQYIGLEVQVTELPDPTDEEVMKSIYNTMQTKGMITTEKVTDRPVKNGDVVTIDYLGKVDGVAFEGGTDEGVQLEIGSNSFIPGFESSIIGHSIGEEFDINVTFPTEYTEELAGKDAVFTIKLHAITGINVPELTDDVATQLAGKTMTATEYMAQERAALIESNRLTVESEKTQLVWRELITHCLVDEFPEDVLQAKIEDVKAQYEYGASLAGMELDAYLQYVYGISSAEMAKDLIKQEYAVKLIAEEEGIIITAEDYDRELAEYAEQYGYEDPKAFEELVGRTELERIIQQNAVGEWLVANCKPIKK